jgi:hypothetical protein
MSRRCDPAGASSNDGCTRPDGNGSERSSSASSRPAGPTCWWGPSAIPIWARCWRSASAVAGAGLGRTAAFRLLPVTDTEADELIDSAEGVATQLDGFRGSAVLDRQALRELMLRFALLLRELPEVVETDLNPVRCMTSGCIVLDTRLRIERRRPVERVKTW